MVSLFRSLLLRNYHKSKPVNQKRQSFLWVDLFCKSILKQTVLFFDPVVQNTVKMQNGLTWWSE